MRVQRNLDDFSQVEVELDACRKRFNEDRGDLNAIRSWDENYIRTQLEKLKTKLNDKDPMPLFGLPMVVKDNLLVEGREVTCGSAMLKGFLAPYSATCITKLMNAGAVIVATANMDEFAMGSSGETSVYGPTKNPVDRALVPGGSSGGSAAAVAAGFCAGALGSDTGGSIRQPASFCGITGFKPSYGRVSRYGLIAFASSLDQVGPLAKCVDDACLFTQSIEGEDQRDATSRALKPLEVPRLPNGKIKVGILTDLIREGLCDDDVLSAFTTATEHLKKHGVELIPVRCPQVELALPCYYVISCAEASSNLSRFDGVRYGARAEASDIEGIYRNSRSQGFGREVKKRIMAGAYVLSAGHYEAYYGKATALRASLNREFTSMFGSCDVLVSPTTPTPAFSIGARSENSIKMYQSDLFTTPANLCGLPSISIPLPVQGKPVGLQIMAPHGEDQRVFDVATLIETIMRGER